MAASTPRCWEGGSDRPVRDFDGEARVRADVEAWRAAIDARLDVEYEAGGALSDSAVGHDEERQELEAAVLAGVAPTAGGAAGTVAAPLRSGEQGDGSENSDDCGLQEESQEQPPEPQDSTAKSAGDFGLTCAAGPQPMEVSPAGGTPVHRCEPCVLCGLAVAGLEPGSACEVCWPSGICAVCGRTAPGLERGGQCELCVNGEPSAPLAVSRRVRFAEGPRLVEALPPGMSAERARELDRLIRLCRAPGRGE